MSDEVYGVGVIGLGVGRHHLQAFQRMPGVKVVAVSDVNPDRLEEFGRATGVPHLYTDYADVIARRDIDLVSVCTPNYLHAPITIAALQAGKHVLCEKPLASNLADAEAMVEAARAAGRVLKVVFNHRERGDVQALKKYIDQGGLGHIYHAKAWWLRRNGIPGMGSWFTQKEMAGGGPLIDLGVHMLDMALFLLGDPEPTTVSAAVYSELGPRGKGGNPYALKQTVKQAYEVEDLASAFIRLDQGMTLLLESSWATYRANNDEFGVTLYGTDGGAEIRVVNYVQDNTLTFYTDIAGVPVDIHPHIGKGEGHAAAIRAFVDAIRAGNWQAEIGYEGLKRTRIIDACYRSATLGQEVAL